MYIACTLWLRWDIIISCLCSQTKYLYTSGTLRGLYQSCTSISLCIKLQAPGSSEGSEAHPSFTCALYRHHKVLEHEQIQPTLQMVSRYFLFSVYLPFFSYAINRKVLEISIFNHPFYVCDHTFSDLSTYRLLCYYWDHGYLYSQCNNQLLAMWGAPL